MIFAGITNAFSFVEINGNNNRNLLEKNLNPQFILLFRKKFIIKIIPS